MLVRLQLIHASPSQTFKYSLFITVSDYVVISFEEFINLPYRLFPVHIYSLAVKNFWPPILLAI